MKLKPFWYRQTVQWSTSLLQGLFAGLLALCLIMVPRALDGEVSLREAAGSFEDTQLFLMTVEETVRDKITAAQDRELFEQDGEFNAQRQIDIRQYMSGVMDEANYNLNTTYYLSDILEFAKEKAPELQNLLYELIEEGMTEEEAGNELMEIATSYETIVPLSGASLADTARMSANPGLTLTGYYRDLCETSIDVRDRYEEYTTLEMPETRSDAPSNIAYYVENTATRKWYTNLKAANIAAAKEEVEAEENLTFLFAGERRFNIMVADTERMFSEKASEWFMHTSFLGSGEQVLIAVDQSYPMGDELRAAYLRYQQREPVLIFGIAAVVVLLSLLLVLFVISLCTNGRTGPGAPVALWVFDQVPTEIAAGLHLIGILGWYYLLGRWLSRHEFSRLRELTGYFILISVEYELCLLTLMSLLRRIHAGTFWSNSVSWYVVAGTRQVYQARKRAQRLIILYIGFVILSLLSRAVGGIPGFLMGLVLNLTVLLYLMRNATGNQNVREGLLQISKGKLDYRINTQALSGESREMGEAVNEMGKGLEKAVENMLQGERLKAELITNVSHDLKTPLTSIINFVDLLKRRNLQDEKAREYVEVLEAKTQRLRQLTEDLIEVSKISSGNIELHPQRLELRQFLQQACGEYEDVLEKKGLTLVFDLCRGPVLVYADGARLWRIMENLLGNVAKYAKAGTNVCITLQVDQGSARVRFQNEPAEKITASADQLKERFVRGDTSRRTEGFGLGLSIADSLTALMGGTFDVAVQENAFEAILSFPVMREGEAAEERKTEPSVSSPR